MRFTNILLGTVVAAVVAGTAWSCRSGEQKLADNLPGIWTGTPEAMTDNQAVTATVTDVYYFKPDTTADSRHPAGQITLQGMISVSTQIVSEGSVIEPLSLSAAAVSTISGSWAVIDDDEVALSLDPSTLRVDVDPDQILANGNVMGVDGSPSVEAVKPEVARNIENSLRIALTERYGRLNVMDDVKIKGMVMKFELGHTDYVLTRRTEKVQ